MAGPRHVRLAAASQAAAEGRFGDAAYGVASAADGTAAAAAVAGWVEAARARGAGEAVARALAARGAALALA